MNAPLYSVSISVYNNLELTKACIESVLKNSDLSQTEIIVCDDGSDDGTKEYLLELSRKSEFVFFALINGENLGYPASQNKNLEWAKGKYFITLNNDLIVPENWLETLREEFDKNTNLGACGILDTCCSLSPDGGGHPGITQDYVEGSLAMYPTELLKKFGLYDPQFRHCYYEDADLSLRLREKGFDIAHVPMEVTHKRASTMGLQRSRGKDIEGYEAYNKLIFKRRWGRYLETRTFRETALLRRRNAIGDVMLVTPIIHAMKQVQAHLEIFVETNHPYIFFRNPDVKMAFEKAPQHPYDYTFDLDDAYELRTDLSVIDAYSQIVGVKVEDRRPRLYPSEEDFKWAKMNCPQEKYAVIHAENNGAFVGRNWIQERFHEVCLRLSAEGWKIVLVGSPNNDIYCDVNMRQKTTLHHLAATIKGAGLFFGVESAPSHCAEAMGTPTVVVMGSCDPSHFIFPSPIVQAVRAENVGCLGCHHQMPIPNRGQGLQCVRDKVYCMEEVTVDMVMDKIHEVLKIQP